jgi:hypothetical protein
MREPKNDFTTKKGEKTNLDNKMGIPALLIARRLVSKNTVSNQQ